MPCAKSLLSPQPIANQKGAPRGCFKGSRRVRFLRGINALAILVIVHLVIVLMSASGARAIEAVSVRTDAPALDLTDAIERQKTESDRIQVSTAPGPDGIVRRVEVHGREAGTDWAVLALANPGDEQIDRLIVVPH